jgi:hypothetical protein
LVHATLLQQSARGRMVVMIYDRSLNVAIFRKFLSQLTKYPKPLTCVTAGTALLLLHNRQRLVECGKRCDLIVIQGLRH